ncbi:MAG: hypothetical protein HY711_06885, partial [Candidatus Melainabacteria bacterium]|nr:hypothetical protein [Candidatus Melainabacteria bacterium]
SMPIAGYLIAQTPGTAGNLIVPVLGDLNAGVAGNGDKPVYQLTLDNLNRIQPILVSQ